MRVDAAIDSNDIKGFVYFNQMVIKIIEEEDKVYIEM